MPGIADQFIVAKRVEELNVGLSCKFNNINDVTPEYIFDCVTEILNNKLYSNNCKKIKESFGNGNSSLIGVDKILEFISC